MRPSYTQKYSANLATSSLFLTVMQPLSTYNIKTIELIVLVELLLLQLVICTHDTWNRKDITARKYNSNTGEPIGIDKLIAKWEFEHQQLYQVEVNEGRPLEWKYLKNINLDVYCRKYLHHCVPRRTTHDAIGSTQNNALHYRIKNKNITAIVKIVICRTQKTSMQYYITRAPESNCVYALNRNVGYSRTSSVYLINKHCNFEQCDYTRIINRKKRRSIDRNFHQLSEQLIAPDEPLRQYELEHEEMCKIKYSHIKWPLEIIHSDIHKCCQKYVQECVPIRHYNIVVGKWMWGTLKYYKENIGKLHETEILLCSGTSRITIRYYFTNAPEPDCLYALFRSEGRTRSHPFQIINKYCYFKDTDAKLKIPETSVAAVQNIQPKIKIEDSATIETKQLFPVI